MQQVSRRVTSTILSMSLLTVMAGAAVAPALGVVRQHFASSSCCKCGLHAVSKACRQGSRNPKAF